MNQLDKKGIALLIYLVGKLEEIVADNPATYVTYKQVHDEMGLRLNGPTYGESLKHQGLTNLADWTVSKNKPGITGMIIDGSSFMPGEGYFRLFQKTNEDFQWWAEQIRQSKNADWSTYIGETDIPDTPIAIDKAPSLADRIETTIYRILRDTNLAKRVKHLNRYECQICGHSIVLSDGSRYAEAHHIKPLGHPHNGPDVLGNIICVCPNHHAELDYGARELVLSKLGTTEDHKIEVEYVTYHNLEIYAKLS